MAAIIPLFEKILDGGGSATSEAWVDLGLIPTGVQIWFGFATMINETTNKNFSFEVRTNKALKSLGTTAETTLHDFSGTTGGNSVDRDFFLFGAVLMQSVVSTGVEHFWLRIRSNSGASGDFSYIIYYTEY